MDWKICASQRPTGHYHVTMLTINSSNRPPELSAAVTQPTSSLSGHMSHAWSFYHASPILRVSLWCRLKCDPRGHQYCVCRLHMLLFYCCDKTSWPRQLNERAYAPRGLRVHHLHGGNGCQQAGMAAGAARWGLTYWNMKQRLWNTKAPTLVPTLRVPLTGDQMFKCLRVYGTFLISTYLSKATHYPFERLYKKVFCFVLFSWIQIGKICSP